jgi:hypothetical protein
MPPTSPVQKIAREPPMPVPRSFPAITARPPEIAIVRPAASLAAWTVAGRQLVPSLDVQTASAPGPGLPNATNPPRSA